MESSKPGPNGLDAGRSDLPLPKSLAAEALHVLTWGAHGNLLVGVA